MTSPKPTRQQIVELLKAYRRTPAHAPFMYDAEEIADILVKAGYAEEPREEGWYWVKSRANDPWKLWRLSRAGSWTAAEDDELIFDPFAVHPSGRITPPEDQ